MTENQLATLTNKRGQIKRKLTEFEKILNSINEETDLDSLDLEGRLNKHNNYWSEFESLQDQIELLTPTTELEIHDAERSSFESRFFKISGLAKKYIKKSSATPSVISFAPQTKRPDGTEGAEPLNLIADENAIQGSTANLLSSRFELPRLQTPTFHGTYDTWLYFHDSFKSMCHDNPSIPVIHKFHYLKACLKGEAAEVIASLETTNENYLVAWELLRNRYDNRKFIVESHVKALFEIPIISKEFSIRCLLDNVQKHVRALKALEQPIEHWDTLLIFIVRGKLNDYTREKWEESVGTTNVPTFKDLTTFLEQRALIQTNQSSQRQNHSHKHNSHSRHSRSQACLTSVVSASSTAFPSRCPICKEQHAIFSCSQFLNLTPKDRYNKIKGTSLCHNCLVKQHRTIECRSGTCKKCKKKHNTLLHFENNRLDDIDQASPSTSNAATSLVSFHSKQFSQTVLGTAMVNVRDSKGQYHPCRALLDACSQCNSMTERLATFLGLTKTSVDITLKGVGNLQERVRHRTSTKIKSLHSDLELSLSFLVFNEISERMPSLTIDKGTLQIPSNIRLADPEFYKQADIDLLIGVEHFYLLLCAGQIRVKGQSAVFQETKLGWIFAGRYVNPHSYTNSLTNSITCNLIRVNDLPILWELAPESNSQQMSDEEKACEIHYTQHTVRDSTGRYSVRLPFNDKKQLLGNSRNTAFQRFYALEKRFAKDSNFKKQYADCIQGYLNESHMSLVSGNEPLDSGYYLPHHAVVKESSITTKTRVVFDGSAKTSTGISLNDSLLLGPTIQQDLYAIVTRFRFFPFVLTADIEQMYRQIRVHPDDRRFQRILWRFNENEKIKTYTLDTVTFGIKCAPFLAVRTLYQLASDERARYPLAAAILERDFYVDDLLTGTQTLEEAVNLRNQLISLLKEGGFNLRKWASNHPQLSSEFQESLPNTFRSLNPTETVKTLGLYWDSVSDVIIYTVNLNTFNDPITKRSILSQLAKLFDPLGLLGPVVVIGKILIQQLWKTKLNWDTPVPSDVRDAWLGYKNQLPLLNNIKFSRCVLIPESIEVHIHGFCDASEKAYGACLYLRSSDKHGNCYTSLICSKSRVAPLKATTLPRLELCAATLLVKLYNITIKALPIRINETYFWSDSTIVLNWIRTPSHTLKTFVANRVSEIQTHTESQQWRHVPSQDNPADYISRGQGPSEFLQNRVWIHGPQWLSQSLETWPQSICHIKDIPEKRNLKPVFIFKLTLSDGNILQRFSTLKKLQFVIAYCLRFINNAKCKDKNVRKQGNISPEELENALYFIIKLTQAEAFPKELHALSTNSQIDCKSSLLNLNPFLEQGIIRVGGRLRHASLPRVQKHPIVLPKNHHVTNLIILKCHIRNMHSGINATLYAVRERFWPIDGRNITRNLIRKCIRCFRAKPREMNYLMGDLPKDRLSFTRPFYQVGVDYCGPFFIKEHRHRNRSKIKTYVCIFVCLATKAVHLELASDLTTDAFIACLKRFFARRGRSVVIYSDNATNFVGASRELKDLLENIEPFERNENVIKFLSNEGISWRFIPPRAPHFGGLWEAAVKSFKTHFVRVAGASLLTYEQLHTYIVEIEAILNSRPITPLSSDPNDLLSLTPGHFLIGDSLVSLPQPDLCNVPINRLKCWELAQQMRQHFWNRWHKEYLNELIARSKWQTATNQDNIAIGTLVVIKEDNTPPMAWKLGRILAVHPGEDGIVRTVTVQGSSGTYKRALKHLYPLPIERD